MPGRPSRQEDEEYLQVRRNRRIRRGLIPQTRNGWLFAGAGALLSLAAIAATALAAVRFMHRDPHFTVASSSSIELHGNTHLARSQLLSIFGEDIDQNIFNIPLAERREQLQQMPWVEHAALMRLLPNRLRVDVIERTPVAFVRQGGKIGMTDAQGVLLDIPPDAPGNPNYSFPVVTGLSSGDSTASRQQRMHLYAALLKDLDSEGKKISTELSEVDLSDPEDVKALLPSGNTETLVHFGTEEFLPRYKRFQEHIGEWRSQYPRLTSVDMRYERQVVLQMPPKDSTMSAAAGADEHTGMKANGLAEVTEPSVRSARNGSPAPAAARAAAPAAARAPMTSSARASAPAAPPARTASVTPAAQGGQKGSSSVAIQPQKAVTAQPAGTHQNPPPAATAAASTPTVSQPGPVRTTEARPFSPHVTPGKGSPPPRFAKRADVAKRVEAIKAWMAKRQKMRDAQAAHPATP